MSNDDDDCNDAGTSTDTFIHIILTLVLLNFVCVSIRENILYMLMWNWCAWQILFICRMRVPSTSSTSSYNIIQNQKKKQNIFLWCGFHGKRMEGDKGIFYVRCALSWEWLSIIKNVDGFPSFFLGVNWFFFHCSCDFILGSFNRWVATIILLLLLTKMYILWY